MIWLLMSLSSLVSSPLLQPAQEPSLSEIGLRFARHLQNGEFTDAHAMLHAGIRGTLTPLRLEHSLLEQAEGMGELQGVQILGGVEKLGSYQKVTVQFRWERGARSVLLIFDHDGTVLGLNWIPLDEAQEKAIAEAPVHVKGRRAAIGDESKPGALPGYLGLPLDKTTRAGVVMVHDLGPFDQNETVAAHTLFLDLAYGLGKRGIASLRYAKRTHHYGTRLYSDGFTVKKEVIDDALLALGVLRDQPEMKGKPVFLLGHGLGGMLAPEIAAQDGHVAGIIMMGAPARPLEDVLTETNKYLESLFTDPSVTQKYETAQVQLNKLRAKTLGARQRLLFAPGSYWYDLCDRDAEVAVKRAASLDCRFLVLQGGHDYQASEADLNLWRAGLADHPDVTCKLIDNVNHMFTKGEGKSSPEEFNLPRTVARPVVELIANWCLKAPKKNGFQGLAPT